MPRNQAKLDSTPRYFLGRNGRPIRCATCESPLFLVDVHPMDRQAVRVEVACAHHCDRICPDCGGETEFVEDPWVHWRYELVGRVECDDCGWSGRIPDRSASALWTRVAERYELEREKENRVSRERAVNEAVTAGLVCPTCRVEALENGYARLRSPELGKLVLARVRTCRVCGPVEMRGWSEIPEPRTMPGALLGGTCQSCDLPIRPTGQCGCS